MPSGEWKKFILFNFFAKLFMKTFVKVIMLMLCCGFMATASVNAQTCPNDLAPTNIPWSWNCAYYSMQWPNGNTCETWICYCYRTVNGKTQIYLSSVGAAAPCPGTGSEWTVEELSLIFTNATRVLIEDNNLTGPCPLCPNGLEIEVINSFCAKAVQDSGGNWSMQVCSGSGYCLKTWRKCCDVHGNMTITLVSTTSSGTTTCAVGCSAVCY